MVNGKNEDDDNSIILVNLFFFSFALTHDCGQDRTCSQVLLGTINNTQKTTDQCGSRKVAMVYSFFCCGPVPLRVQCPPPDLLHRVLFATNGYTLVHGHHSIISHSSPLLDQYPPLRRTLSEGGGGMQLF